MTIYYSNREQLARTVIVDPTTSNIIRNESEYSTRELLVSLMMMQDFIYFNPDGLGTLQISAASSSQGFRVNLHKIQDPPELYIKLRERGLDPTMCEYTIGGYAYIFTNTDISTIMTTPDII